ncbi:MAG: class I SAM-dependent methyltransferase [Anaerolineae bacterium]|nr:class I SAM-dependent methyltransferase [Anaerolineae bacterium]
MPRLNKMKAQPAAGSQNGLLGDTPQKAYVTKLDLFNRFAEPELRQVIAGLGLSTTARVLDAGCGTGLITLWLAEHVSDGLAVGVDLSTGHLRHARKRLISSSTTPLNFLQADIAHLPLTMGPFDLIWSSNAINHLRHPVAGLKRLAANLHPGGRLVLAQSAFLPDMFFAWDARLEQEVTLACRRYYRDKYGLDERDTTATRNLFGWMHQAGFTDVIAKTVVIERTAPLTEADQIYFVDGVFNGYWAHRVQPYLSEPDWHTLEALCDPTSPEFCLRRTDFHHVQTFSLVVGQTL